METKFSFTLLQPVVVVVRVGVLVSVLGVMTVGVLVSVLGVASLNPHPIVSVATMSSPTLAVAALAPYVTAAIPASNAHPSVPVGAMGYPSRPVGSMAFVGMLLSTPHPWITPKMESIPTRAPIK